MRKTSFLHAQYLISIGVRKIQEVFSYYNSENQIKNPTISKNVTEDPTWAAITTQNAMENQRLRNRWGFSWFFSFRCRSRWIFRNKLGFIFDFLN